MEMEKKQNKEKQSKYLPGVPFSETQSRKS